jgi:hypothetical protein
MSDRVLKGELDQKGVDTLKGYLGKDCEGKPECQPSGLDYTYPFGGGGVHVVQKHQDSDPLGTYDVTVTISGDFSERDGLTTKIVGLGLK